VVRLLLFLGGAACLITAVAHMIDGDTRSASSMLTLGFVIVIASTLLEQ
jgi:hypothetical protein